MRAGSQVQMRSSIGVLQRLRRTSSIFSPSSFKSRTVLKKARASAVLLISITPGLETA